MRLASLALRHSRQLWTIVATPTRCEELQELHSEVTILMHSGCHNALRTKLHSAVLSLYKGEGLLYAHTPSCKSFWTLVQKSVQDGSTWPHHIHTSLRTCVPIRRTLLRVDLDILHCAMWLMALMPRHNLASNSLALNKAPLKTRMVDAESMT